jgi:hypothetical protein
MTKPYSEDLRTRVVAAVGAGGAAARRRNSSASACHCYPPLFPSHRRYAGCAFPIQDAVFAACYRGLSEQAQLLAQARRRPEQITT